jgi:hypothetical protein
MTTKPEAAQEFTDDLARPGFRRKIGPGRRFRGGSLA